MPFTTVLFTSSVRVGIATLLHYCHVLKGRVIDLTDIITYEFNSSVLHKYPRSFLKARTQNWVITFPDITLQTTSDKQEPRLLQIQRNWWRTKKKFHCSCLFKNPNYCRYNKPACCPISSFLFQSSSHFYYSVSFHFYINPTHSNYYCEHINTVI